MVVCINVAMATLKNLVSYFNVSTNTNTKKMPILDAPISVGVVVNFIIQISKRVHSCI